MITKPYYEVLNFNVPKQREKWLSICNSFHNIDIFYFPQYAHLFELNGDGTASCFVYYQSEKDMVIYPFLIRSINEIPVFKNLVNNYYDITSPYGYAGYLSNSKIVNMELFYSYFQEYCFNNNIICEFIRFNPLLNNVIKAPKCINIKKSNEIVVLDLFQDIDKINSDINPKCRNKIKKAIKKDVKIIKDDKYEYFNIFINLYIHTMKRLKSHRYYLFSHNFFHSLLNLLEENIFLFHATHESNIINSALFIYKNDFIHYFLSGSDEDNRNYAGNNLLLYEVAMWAKKNGFRYLNLGGGYQSDDSLFKFKSSFSKYYLDFYIGNNIFNNDIYNYLCDNTKVKNLGEKIYYFPLYRYNT